jgi:hypothetical protein
MVDCPECGKEISAKATSCKCGWTKKEKSFRRELACDFDMNGYPCGKKADFNFQRKDKSYFALCENHYDQVREKSDIEIEMLRRAKIYSDGAKSQGMTAYEFLHGKKPPERALKELLGWASHGRRK